MRRSVYVRVPNSIITKRKNPSITTNTICLSPNFSDCFIRLPVKIRGKIYLKVNCENAVARAKGVVGFNLCVPVVLSKDSFSLFVSCWLRCFKSVLMASLRAPRAHSAQYDLLGQNSAHAGFRLLSKSETSLIKEILRKKVKKFQPVDWEALLQNVNVCRVKRF